MRNLFVVAALMLAACDVGEVDVMQLAIDDYAAGQDPCKDPAIVKRATVKADKDNPHRFVGTNDNDVIVGTEGDDEIYGLDGDDLICGLGGNDYIDGGDGKDRIYAGDGDDIVHGRGASDWIYGGPGDDLLFGDILDDHIFGEDGDDIIIGGHGTDEMDGGAGENFMRGDTGNDTFIGGPGYDIASFATALPPGQPEFEADDVTASPIDGVRVTKVTNPTSPCYNMYCADGDGGDEELRDIDMIVGSPFSDQIDPNGRDVQSGLGEDVINGTKTGTPTPTSTVYIDAVKNRAGQLIDVGVVVLGSTGNDHYQVHGNNLIVTIDADAALTAVAPCVNLTADSVKCDVGTWYESQPHRGNPFHYLLAWLDDGDDTFTVDGTFPRDFELHASGGPGNDHLVGGDEQDIFFTGTDGSDHLEGMGGDDALIGESHHTSAWDNDDRPRVEDYHDGADIFDGGSGNDQLVVDYVCGGHTYIGGDGFDIAGFARSGKHSIHAQLAGQSSLHTQWFGKAANMDLCGDMQSAWTTMHPDLEVLEASSGPDYLWGNDLANTIWGRAGGDHIWGLGGNDTIEGAGGNDVIDAGGQPGDKVSYGADD
jgi:Ca2+-binding RTX toxin-like protein